jgi:hypothetical protein
MAPGGVQIIASLIDGQVQIIKPVDAVVANHTIPTIFDIVPNKGATVQGVGGHTFIIGGANLDSIGAFCANVLRSFGGIGDEAIRSRKHAPGTQHVACSTVCRDCLQRAGSRLHSQGSPWVPTSVRSRTLVPAKLTSITRCSRKRRSLYAAPFLTWKCVDAVGAVTVKFGGVVATEAMVVGKTWIKGKIPNNSAGLCPTDVSVVYTDATSGATVTLILREGFCYAPFA